MLDSVQFARATQSLPVLQKAGTSFTREFQQKAFWAGIPAGRDVFVEGDRVEAIALLISGVVRVYKVGETGREITLYRFGNGSSCILTANAILSQKTFPAIATVEQNAEAVMIPAEVFRDWVKRYDLWREFVFDLLSQRLSNVMAVIDEVAFQRMDRRVASLLFGKSQPAEPAAHHPPGDCRRIGKFARGHQPPVGGLCQRGQHPLRARHRRSAGFRIPEIPLPCVTLSQTDFVTSPILGASNQPKEIYKL